MDAKLIADYLSTRSSEQLLALLARAAEIRLARGQRISGWKEMLSETHWDYLGEEEF